LLLHLAARFTAASSRLLQHGVTRAMMDRFLVVQETSSLPT
jgi:hypothetical protein